MSRALPFRTSPPVLSVKARAVPIVSTMVGSIIPLLLPIVAQSPLVPPFGLLMLLAWRLMRPGFWTPWAALPLGFFDDLASGQPVGSAMLSWTIALLAIDLSERTLLWRDYVQDWFVAALAVSGCILAGYLFAMLAGGGAPLSGPAMQCLAAILVFPLIARICARLDAWRLR